MKSLIFANNTLKGDEYNLYRQIFEIIYNSIPKPDLYVYLHLSTEKLLENIHKRGRDYEQKITAEYLDEIQKGYFDFFKQHPEYTFLVIDTSNLDFVSNHVDYLKLKKVIFDQSYIKGIHRVTF